MSITFVGHATVMITTPGVRLLADPLLENSFYGIRRAQAAGLAEEDLDDVDLVLVTHAHRDHLSRGSIVRIARKAVLIVPPRCTSLVRGLGFADIVELDPGSSHQLGDVEVTAVPVRHLGDGAASATTSAVVPAVTWCARAPCRPRRAPAPTSPATPATFGLRRDRTPLSP